MSSSIILPAAFDVSKMTVGNVKSLDNGGKIVYISHNEKPLIVQTPEMTVPFGMSRWNADGTGAGGGVDKYTIELSFKDRETRPSLSKFFDMMGTVDKFMLNSAIENSQAWFKKKYSTTEIVDALYTPCVKFPKDKATGEITDKYPPTFRLSLPFRNGAFAVETFDNDKNKINLLDVETKGSKITAIIQLSGVWLAGGKFGCSWKVLQMRVVPPSTIKGFAFQDIDEDKLVDSDIDDDEQERAIVPSSSKKQQPAKKADLLSDSDDDNDDASPPPPHVESKSDVPIEDSDDDDDDDDIDAPKAKKSVIVRKKK